MQAADRACQKIYSYKQRKAYHQTNDKAGDFVMKSPALVRVARIERAASTSQMWRPTNWAIPGYMKLRGNKNLREVVKYVVKRGFAKRGNRDLPSAARGFAAAILAGSGVSASSQMWRPTNWATSGQHYGVFYPKGWRMSSKKMPRDFSRGKSFIARVLCKVGQTATRKSRKQRR